MFSDDDDDDNDDESDAEELWASSFTRLLSSSKLRCVDSHGISGEQLTGETSQRRFNGLTPGSTKPSDGHFLFNNKLLGRRQTGLRLLRVWKVSRVGLGTGLGVRLLAFRLETPL